VELADLPAQITVIPYDSWSNKSEDFRFRDYFYLNNVTLLTALATDDAFMPEYQELFDRVQDDLRQLSWETNAQLGSETFVLRQLENIAENRVPAACLKNLFHGKTAVLLAGGPSLDDIFPWLKENRAKIVVFAVSRICRRLREVNVTPDIIVSIDPHPVSFDVSKEMLYFWERTLFINHFHVVPTLLGQWRGRSVYLGNRFPWETPRNEENLHMPGPTVSNTALSTAIEMGFSQIILAGMDLCFRSDGQTYAKGSNESDTGPKLGQVFAQVKTNGGWMAETGNDFKASVRMLGEQAEQAIKSGCRIINPAVGAAMIPNVEFLGIDEVVIEPLKESFLPTIDLALPPNTKNERCQHYKQMAKELTRAYGEVLNIRKLANEALRCNDGLFGRKGMQANFKYKKRMDKIERSLNTKYKKIIRLVKQFGIRNFLKLTRPDPDREWKNEEIEKIGRIYYEAMRDSSGRLAKLIKDAGRRLEARLEEEKESPDFRCLFSQWEKDNHPGRVFVWQTHRHPSENKIEPETKAKMEKMIEEYFNIVTNHETEHMRRCRKESTLNGVRSRALMLFKRRDKNALEKLSIMLTVHPDKNSKALHNLTQGYLNELNDETSQALENYQHLMMVEHREDPVLEDGLRRISSICLKLNDTANALTALECLSTISPPYMPQFADLLRILGKHQQAMTIYTNYLEKVPSDLVTMLKVGKYYLELDIKEGASMMFQCVLQQAPENNAAKHMLETMSCS
jgi:hypothetical protein